MFIVREKATRVSSSLVNINQTRLKDIIINITKVSDIKAYQKGKEVVLVFEKDVGQTMITDFEYTDATCMYKTRQLRSSKRK
jgi:nitrate reductase NapAB chaperone NapD